MAIHGEAFSLDELVRLPRRTVRRPAADVRAATIVALQNGARIVPHPVYPDAAQHVVWDIAGNCTAPWLLHQVGEGHHQAGTAWAEVAWQPNRSLCQRVRCRKCKACLHCRRLLWQRRGAAEWRDASLGGLRTWFITLTFRPEERYRHMAETWNRVGPGFHRLGPEDQARELGRTVGRFVTLWLKRLRKAGAKFRYLLVTEPHKDGFPHFHLLMHEVEDLKPLRKRLLQAQWASHGFSQAKLVETAGAASYVAKYLAKTTMVRVRASRHYGMLDVAIPGRVPVQVSRSLSLISSTAVEAVLRRRECEAGKTECSANARKEAGASEGGDSENNVLEHSLLEGVHLSPPNEQPTLVPLNQSREVLGLPLQEGARPTRPEHGGSLTAFVEEPLHARGPLPMRYVTHCNGEATGPPAR